MQDTLGDETGVSREWRGPTLLTDLMPASDPNWARTGLQAEGDRWLELEIIHTEHGLARQPEVGHRNCDLLIVVIPGHNFHHITLVRGPLGKAQLKGRQNLSVSSEGGLTPKPRRLTPKSA